MRLYNGVLFIRTLYLIAFARYSASKISVSNHDLSGSPKVKYFYFFRKLVCNFIMVLCWYELSISYRLRDIPHLTFRFSDLDLSGSPKDKYFIFLGKITCDFLMVSDWYELSILHHLRYIRCQNYEYLARNPHLTFSRSGAWFNPNRC